MHRLRNSQRAGARLSASLESANVNTVCPDPYERQLACDSPVLISFFAIERDLITKANMDRKPSKKCDKFGKEFLAKSL